MKTLFPMLFLALLGSSGLHAETLTWTGTNNASIQVATNWVDSLGNAPTGSPAVKSSDKVVFGPTGGHTVRVNSGVTIEGWTFNSAETYSFVFNDAYNLGFAGNATATPQFLKYGAGDVILPRFHLAGQRVFWGESGSGTVVFNGVLSNPGSGAGGGVTMEGAIRILVTGSQAAPAAPSTNSWRFNSSNAVLSGTGTLTSLVENSMTANRGANGATLDPGVSGTAGTFTFKGGLKLERSTNLNFDLGGLGGANDKIAITGGTFTLRAPESGKFVLNLSNLGITELTIGSPITLIESTQGGAVTFDFATVSSSDFTFGAMPGGWVGDQSYGTGGIFFDTSTGMLSVQLIPEPGVLTATLLGVGMVVVAARRRMRVK
jgi:hypothetical protein